MSLIPIAVLPCAFACLIQNFLSVHHNSEEGITVFTLTMISWHLFVNKTARGRMVFDAWVVTPNMQNETIAAKNNKRDDDESI